MSLTTKNSTTNRFPMLILPEFSFKPQGILPDRISILEPETFLPDRISIQEPEAILPDRIPILEPEAILPDRIPILEPETIPPELEPESILPDRFQFSTPSSIEVVQTSTALISQIANLPPEIETIFIPEREPVTDLPEPFETLSPFPQINASVFDSTSSLLDNGKQFSAENSIFCGFPGVCQGSLIDIYNQCADIPLLSCDKCDLTRGAVFLSFVILLGLAILIGNILIICVGIQRHRKNKHTKMDLCRSSLALADLTTGIQILVVIVYNFSWSMKLTAKELNMEQLALRGTVRAYAGGILYFFGFTASLYHLIFIGLQRLYAIAKPINYKWQTDKPVFIGLAIVWCLSLMTSTIPAWQPSEITFTYIPSIFLYFPTTLKASEDQNYSALIALTIVFFVFPFVLMTCTTVATAVLIYKHNAHSEKIRSKHSQIPKKISKKKVSVFVTIAVMQIGFTVTLIPVVIVVSLFYSGHLTCYNVSIPYVVCFYFSMSNSFVNILIYNIRDKAFRSTLGNLFTGSFFQRGGRNISNSHVNSNLQQESRFSSNEHAISATVQTKI
ncbi:uncharacterized protein LOC143447091 [Clavelina lepadiformis]|uniref:uncharacterized protein LOC143447091 n=1 Tax=Clavelina lepadiformis TaxID=159417 RepID=UPI004042A134